MTLPKNVKSRVFFKFSKNVKNVFSNYDAAYTCAQPQITVR